MKKQANCLRCLKYQEIGAKRHSQITGSLPAARRVIGGGELTGIEQKVLRTNSSSEFRAWLVAGAAAIGATLEGYGARWGIYRRKSLFDFATAWESNELQNLEVRPLHTRKGEKA